MHCETLQSRKALSRLLVRVQVFNLFYLFNGSHHIEQHDIVGVRDLSLTASSDYHTHLYADLTAWLDLSREES